MERQKLRVIVERNEEGGLFAAWHAHEGVEIELVLADQNLDNAETVYDVDGEDRDVWVMDVSHHPERVAQVLAAFEPEPMPVAPAEPDAEAVMRMIEDDQLPEPPRLLDIEDLEDDEIDAAEVEATLAAYDEITMVDAGEDDDPNCDYCGAFVGHGLREDFPKLACEKCDRA